MGQHSVSLTGAAMPDALTLSFALEGHDYRLALERATPPVDPSYRSYRVSAGRLVESDTVPDLDCLYRGVVEPIDGAEAALAEPGFATVSLCGGAGAARGQGVTGYVRALGRHWKLSPDPAATDTSDGVAHLALPLHRGDTPGAAIEVARPTRLLRQFETPLVTLPYLEGTPSETKYIDLIVVHDAARSDNLGNLAEADGILFVETMNSLLEQSGLVPRVRVTLRAQVRFDEDPYTPELQGQEVNHEVLLRDFLDWGAAADLPAHDEHMLLSGLDFLANTVGFAGLDVACNPGSNGFILEADDTGGGFPILSAVHEMGHTLGMDHDDGVTCPNQGFIMASIGCSNCGGDVEFSSCSIDQFNDYLNGPAYAEGAFCADDVPAAAAVASCGDGVVSAGETCDCGASDCSDIDPCCDGARCELEDGAECSDYNDGCCQGCSVVSAAAASVCRPALSNCDTAERCTGASKDCPPDSFASAGGVCEDERGNTGSCYLGDCRSRGTQCELIAEQAGFPNIGSPGPNCDLGCGEVMCGDDNGCVRIQNTAVIDGVSCDAGQCVGQTCVALIDQCPGDPLKAEPGACGCGTSDADPDGDDAPSCVDGCPADASKQAPGECGCGQSDADSDADGALDCREDCATDSAKQEPGVCGCGQSDADSDGDGTPNCNDQCPDDPGSVTAGACGCGRPETDSDQDGIADCDDACPNNPDRSEEPCGSAADNAVSVSASASGGCSVAGPARSSRELQTYGPAAWFALFALAWGRRWSVSKRRA